MSLFTDVQILKKSPIAEVRENIAVKVSEYLNSNAFDEQEVQIAFDIIRLLTKDVEIRVRKALSESLKENPELPHDVAVSLARDEIEVSVPILETSSVLTEGDLMEIIRSTKEVAKIAAIARRQGVSEPLSSAIIHTHYEDPVVQLISNKTAKISDESLSDLIKDFKDQGNVLSCLVDRGGLSIAIAEKLLNYVSGDLHERLVVDYKLSADVAENIAKSSHEKATLGLLQDNKFKIDEPKKYLEPDQVKADDQNEKFKMQKVEKLVLHLNNVGRLTHSLVIRSLCEGNILFFETSMAVSAGVKLDSAKQVIRSCNAEKINELCKQADIPESFWAAMNVIIKFAVESGDIEEKNKSSYASRLTEYVISNGYDSSIALMPYILVLVGSVLQTRDIIAK